MVTGLCRALLRDVTEAEDAAQQVFLSAHRSLLNGAEPREAPAWLATIARNECWSRISGRMREPLPSDAADDVAGTADPVAEAIRRADLAALWRGIRALPYQQREALLLREFGGLRYDELAAALAVSEPAIESLLFRARTRLRAQLQSAAAALAPLARLLAGGGAPAVAVKAAALGLGAAAVTGTAVIAPTMLERRSHSAPPRVSLALRAVRDTAPIAVLQVPAVVHHVARHVTETPTETDRHDDGGTATTGETEHHDGGGTETNGDTERHDGGGTATTGDTERHDGGSTTTATSTTTSSSGDGAHESGSTSTGSTNSGSGGGESHDQTATTTATTTSLVPAVTIPTVEKSGDSGGLSDGSGH